MRNMANQDHLEWALDKMRWAEFRTLQPTQVPDLRDADLEEAPLWGDFSGALFDRSRLKAASMPAELDGASFIGANLRRARMQGDREFREEFQRRGAIFRTAHMTDAFLMDGDYTKADFLGADLRGAKLNGSLLVKANFSGANLQDAVFEEAVLTGAVFSGARFKNTTFAKAVCGDTIFDAVDLSLATHLESIEHLSPSTVSLATMFRSNGRISDKFLAAAHPEIPEEQLRELGKALRAMRSEYHSCFISYARSDAGFVKKLKRSFEGQQIPLWIDSQSLLPGEDFEEKIITAIGRADRFIVVLSAAALESSWVCKELAIATGTDRLRDSSEGTQDRTDIVPVRLDDEVLRRTDTPWSSLLTREITDFSNPRQFRAQFERLAKSLRRAEAS